MSTTPADRPPTPEDVRDAARRIAGRALRTPVLTCGTLDALCGGRLFFKCENFQKVGAFKFRGAANAVLSLSDEESRRGVATHSSGNHAQALALAARIRGIPALIVMPESSPRVKVEAVRGYGARVVFCTDTLEARETTLAAEVEKTGACFIHPYNHTRVIAGQGTCAAELLEEVPDLDAVIAPVGGGGLLSGTAIAVRALSARTRVFGAEPEAADDAYRSFTSGTLMPSVNPRTIADGLRTSLGSLTFPIIREKVSGIVRVSERQIVQAMRLVWERMKIVVEPSAAVPVAAALSGELGVKGRRVGLILSGGNVDLDSLPWQNR
jgi:threonine dehydratase